MHCKKLLANKREHVPSRFALYTRICLNVALLRDDEKSRRYGLYKYWLTTKTSLAVKLRRQDFLTVDL